MECVHCKKHFPTDTFDAHCREHVEIQTRLKRPTRRTYGARYDPKTSSQYLQSEGPNAQNQAAGSSVSLGAVSSVRQSEETIPSRQRAPEGLDKRIQFIIDSFPPYEGGGVEAFWPATPDFECKDCNFKFRAKKECDEHYLSKYCRGASIVLYSLTIDKSRPCGYTVEKEIQPLDGIKDPSLFQCRKCSSMFTSEPEMENHQKSHLVSPSRCLHCHKMFSTKYELDDHYDWHDDMDYRQRIDGLHIISTPHETNKPDVLQDEILDLSRDMKNMPFPSPADEGRKQVISKDGQLGGISFISAEDVERVVAPDGYYQAAPTKYVHARPDGTVVSEALEMPMTGSSLPIMAHGKQGGYILCVDVVGRHRWMKKARAMINRVRDHEAVRTHTEAAEELEKRGQLDEAMDCWIKALDAHAKLDSDDQENTKFLMLVKVTQLASKLDMFEVAVEYNLRALELSIKQFGNDSINNFYRINDLAVVYDKQGILREAAYLYRRSLLGRIKINGLDHADTLMTMQELANVYHQLGNIDEARLLLEKSYIGHENLEEPNEQNTMGTLNNLAAIYNELGQAPEAVQLLESAIPRMGRSLGPGNVATCGAVRNLLTFTKGNAVSVEVQDVLRDMQLDMTEAGSMTIQAYADFLARNRRLGEALSLYQKSYDWARARFGASDYNKIQSLHRLARCLDYLQKLPEAENAFRQLASLTAHSPANQSLHRTAIDAVSQLSARKDQLQAELVSWGLDKPGRCACGKSTLRLCPCCQMKRICSGECQQASEAHKDCYPSVTPKQSISMTQQPMPAGELEAMFRDMFARDPMTSGALKLISSEAFFVNPTSFATFRVWKDPTKFVSYYFTKADARIAFGNLGSVDWQSSQRMRTTYMYPSTNEDPMYLLVAPGEGMFRSAKYEWERTTETSSDIQFPNSSMIEYLQSEEPRRVDMQLAVVVMVWER